jgi:hypothetical protein
VCVAVAVLADDEEGRRVDPAVDEFDRGPDAGGTGADDQDAARDGLVGAAVV